MLSDLEFVRISLETNLFFQRIIKEHLFFIETALPPVEKALIQEAAALKQGIEQILAHTVFYSNGVISQNAERSGEFVTPYTLKAEELNSRLTGAKINTGITRAEYELQSGAGPVYRPWLEAVTEEINSSTYRLLKEALSFQKKLLAARLECRIFIALYPELLDHVNHETEYYLRLLEALMKRELPDKTLCDELNFWNHIMEEHAKFIDGMLDPTETGLKETARAAAEAFEKLVRECTGSSEKQIVQNSLRSVEGIRNYKTAATEGLLQCKIKSIILPLLADHVLREANHYIRLLESMHRQ